MTVFPELLTRAENILRGHNKCFQDGDHEFVPKNIFAKALMFQPLSSSSPATKLSMKRAREQSDDEDQSLSKKNHAFEPKMFPQTPGLPTSCSEALDQSIHAALVAPSPTMQVSLTSQTIRSSSSNIPETSLNQLALCKPVSSQFHSSSELVRQMEPTPSHNPHINNAMYFSSSSSSLSPLEPSPYSDLPVEIQPTSYGVSPSIQSPQKPLNVVPSADNTSYSAAQPFQNHWTPYSVTPSFPSQSAPLNVAASSENSPYNVAQPFQNHWTPYSVSRPLLTPYNVAPSLPTKTPLNGDPLQDSLHSVAHRFEMRPDPYSISPPVPNQPTPTSVGLSAEHHSSTPSLVLPLLASSSQSSQEVALHYIYLYY